MTPGMTDPDVWLSNHTGPPADPDTWLAQKQAAPQQAPESFASQLGKRIYGLLPQSMQDYMGKVDTSRFEKEQQKGWQPFQQIGEGVKTAATGPDMQTRASGVHEALTGAMDAGAHLLPAIAPMNLVGTAAGVVAGTAVGAGTQFGLKAAGVPEPYANVAGDVTGIVAGGLAGKGASRLTGGALVGADPETLSWQALQPRGGSKAHYNNAPVVMGDIKAAAVRRGLPITSARELQGAIDSAELDNRDAFSQHWNQVQMRIPTDHVADLIDQTLDPETRRLASLGNQEAIDHVNAVHGYANTFRGQTVTPDEFRQLQEHVNAEDDVFQKKSDEKQAKIIAARGGDPTIRAKATAFRDLVRQYAGDDAADLQTRYGLLRDWNAAAQKAMDKALTEKTGTSLQQAAQAADVPGQVLTGNIEKTPPLKGTTDQKIRWAFDKVDPAPAPRLPQNLTGTQGAVANIFPGVNAPRLLPQGSAPLTQGTTAINPAANMPKGPQANPYRAGLLGPGSPTQGQGTIPVPPPGAGNVFTEGGPPLIQVPPRAPGQNVAAPPADTSFVRGVPAQRATPTSGPTEPAYHATRSASDVEGIFRRGAIYPAGDPGNTSGFVSTTTRPAKNYSAAPAYLEIDPGKTPLEPYDYFSGKPKQVNGQTVPGYEGGPNDPRFEHEFRARGPVPVSSIKAIHINPNLGADDAYAIKSSAAKAGVPVVEGSPAFGPQESMSQRLARAAWKVLGGPEVQ